MQHITQWTKNIESIAEEETSLKRWGKPEEVAKIASHLASDDFSYSTGNTIIVDGGTIMI